MLKTMFAIEEVTSPSVVSAEEAGLRFVSDDEPGISRRRSGNSFRYKSSSGAAIKDQRSLARIRSLVIPPAWTEAWICTRADGHIQATGRDALRTQTVPLSSRLDARARRGQV